MAKTKGTAKERARVAAKQKSAEIRDIGTLPLVTNLRRRSRGLSSLKLFLEAYFPERFYLEWADIHIEAIEETEDNIRNGGRLAIALSRSTGKTTIIECAVMWAILTGLHKYVFVLAATKPLAKELLANILKELVKNDLLLEDFPEVVFPLRALDGETRSTAGQTYMGKRTEIKIAADRLEFPLIAGSVCSGSLIKCAGITGAVRGAVITNSTGQRLRPSLAVLDDVQTDTSARSPSQIKKICGLIDNAVAGLAGVGVKITMLMPCTVIQPNDVSDIYLTREKSPTWRGIRYGLLHTLPSNTELWEEYANVRRAGLIDGEGVKPSNDFYAKHQEALDEGAKATWTVWFDKDELSAIQHAMNLKIANEQVFWAEYMNQPLLDADGADDTQLQPDAVLEKINGRKRGELGADVETVTMFIDIMGKALYYTVLAFTVDGTSAIIDYGVYPKQAKEYHRLTDIDPTLIDKYDGALDQKGAWQRGLHELLAVYMSTEYTRRDGSPLKIARCGIDANDGNAKDVVDAVCYESEYTEKLVPCRGIGLGAKSRGFNAAAKKEGERRGAGWRLNPAVGGMPRHLLSDTNYWKEHVRGKLSLPLEASESMTINGDRKNTDKTAMLADELAAEYFIDVEAAGRKAREWSLRPGRENHFFDCTVGCCVLASLEGVRTSVQCASDVEEVVRTFTMDAARFK